jgi:SAM-dependent methyltransferase
MLRVRRIAAMTFDELMELIRSYQPSRILLTAVELDLFTAVAGAEPATSQRLASSLSTDLRATETLLNALTALGLLSKQEGAFSTSPLARRFLVAGAEDDSRAALRHNSSLWKTWSTLTDCVRTGHAAAATEMRDRGDDWTGPFIAAMHRNATLRAPLVVKAVGAEGVSRLLDVGGGSGAYSIAFAQANPRLQAEVFDLATVVPIAQGHVAAAGLAARVRTRVGDLRVDQLGNGYDLVLVSAICHMLGPDENRDLLRRAFQALAPGGRVAIQDHVMEPDGTAPRAGALFAVNMLVGTAQGGCYSGQQYTAWLEEAGFASVRRISLPGPNDLMVAARPGN